jgi:hypothetical protein
MRTSVLIAATAIVIAFVETLRSQAAGSQSGHWFYQMDRDKNGSVSRTEFVQFMSRKVNRVETRFLSLRFNSLDTNHNGRLAFVTGGLPQTNSGRSALATADPGIPSSCRFGLAFKFYLTQRSEERNAAACPDYLCSPFEKNGLM